MTIPLHVIIENQQPIRFRIFDVQNFDESQPIFIHDKEDDLFVDLRTQNYELTLEPGDYSQRFEITFRSSSLSTDDVTFEDFTIYQNNSLSELNIINPKQLEINSINLFDVNGKQVFNKADLPIESNYKYSTKSLSDGVYVAKINFESGQGLSKKIIVANKQ